MKRKRKGDLKMKKIIIIVMLAIILVLIVFGVFAIQYMWSIPCKNESGHFQDRFGNPYCSTEEPINYFTIENKVCLLNKEES